MKPTDYFWTTVDRFVLISKNLFASATTEKSFKSLIDSIFRSPNPYGLPSHDIGRHVRQDRLLFHPLFFSSEATFDMAFR